MDLRLVALHAHPDDESSKGAGTVARYVRAGVRAVLVTATGGEAGDVLNPELDHAETLERLAELRREELLTAARIIGFADVVMLGYRDSGMPDTPDNAHPDAFVNAEFAEVLGRMVVILRRERPHVLLGYDDHEWYPHPDHLMVHRVAIAAFEAAAEPGLYPEAGPAWSISKLYAPTWTAVRVRKLHAAMVERGLESPFERWLDGIHDRDDEGRRITSVDIGSEIEIAREALRSHRTQIDPNGRWFQVPVDVERAAYPYEDFELIESRVQDDPSSRDLFAGL